MQAGIAAGDDFDEAAFIAREIEDCDIGGDDQRISKLPQRGRVFIADDRCGEAEIIGRLPAQARAIFNQRTKIGKVGETHIAVDREPADATQRADAAIDQRQFQVERTVDILTGQIGGGDYSTAYGDAVDRLPVKAVAQGDLRGSCLPVEQFAGKGAAHGKRAATAVSGIGSGEQKVVAQRRSKGIDRSRGDAAAQCGEITIGLGQRLAVDQRIVAGQRPAPSGDRQVESKAGLRGLRRAFAV